MARPHPDPTVSATPGADEHQLRRQHERPSAAVAPPAAARDATAHGTENRRIESLTTATGGLVHDVANQLTVLLGHLELARDRLPEDHPALLELAAAGAAADGLTALIDQLRDYLGWPTEVPERREVGPVLAEVCDELDAASPVPIGVVVAPLLPPAVIDAALLARLLQPLVANAHEAGARAVTIDVDAVDVLAPPQAEPDRAWSDPSRPGSYVRLRVRDDGCGIDLAQLDRVFDPFTGSKGIGRGLGLAVVAGLLRRLGGAAMVRRLPVACGPGTELTLLLPTVDVGGSPWDDTVVEQLEAQTRRHQAGVEGLAERDGGREHTGHVRTIVLDE